MPETAFYGSDLAHVHDEPDEVIGWLQAAGFAASCHSSYGDAPGLPGVHVYVATRLRE